jgi:hypothetical protein
VTARSDIKSRWAKHLGRPFPSSCARGKIAGLFMTDVDSCLAGCIGAFVEDDVLDPERLSILRRVGRELETVLPHLSGEDLLYFEELLALSKAVEALHAH